VGCVEVDVSRTRDEALVALHTRQLRSIADGEFDSVGQARLDELQAFGLAKGSHSAVLTLHEALTTLSGRGMQIILDVKDAPPLGSAHFAAAAMDAVREAHCTECIIWAKDDDIVRELVAAEEAARPSRPGGPRRALPAQPSRRQALDTADPPTPPFRSGFVLLNETLAHREAGMGRLGRLRGADVVAAHWAMVDADLVQRARSKRLGVFGWTANTGEMADALIRAGVAAIVTDQPDLVAERMERLYESCPNR
jgi:glycerophosphoryl diester phosphodiesterase